jgi:hypothetical protein
MIRAAAVLCLIAAPAMAQQRTVCMERPAFLAGYLATYGETPVVGGLSGQQGEAIMEILASPEGTWTLIETDANGISCRIGAGHGFTIAPSAGEPS